MTGMIAIVLMYILLIVQEYRHNKRMSKAIAALRVYATAHYQGELAQQTLREIDDGRGDRVR